jgi:hypothetical protein
MGSHDKTKEKDMSEWTKQLAETYTIAEIQDQAKQLGIKNIKKFTKAALAEEIEKVLDKKSADEDHLHENDTDKTEENDMNVNDAAAIAELEALLRPITAEELAEEEAKATEIANQIMGIEPFTVEEVAGIAETTTLEQIIEDQPGENDTEAAVKLTDEIKAMLVEVRANAAKRKHPVWKDLVVAADDITLAQIVGKANTVRGMLWKIGKSIAPTIAAYDAALVPAADEPVTETAETTEMIDA